MDNGGGRGGIICMSDDAAFRPPAEWCLEKGMAAIPGMDEDGVLLPRKLALCRICHDDDEPVKMEAPCSCRGSLKYAHRRCIQMWCNQKGNTICEICLQGFRPGYSTPPPRLPIAIIPLRLRDPWELPRTDHYNHPPVFVSEHNFFNQSFDDYAAPTASIFFIDAEDNWDSAATVCHV
ncbi:hypothetical protein KSS87_007396 [Heliosperma pusillum]|nr:hypothetical protein KSS87_007396 [Heliosperma pusillum]